MSNLNQYHHYYPYGMQMPGRHGTDGDGYRYGFNGMESDNEVSGEKNSYTTEFRQYDPRIARWKSLDPIFKDHESPYSAFSNNPIWFADPNGADTILYSKLGGVELAKKESDSPKTPIWVVDTGHDDYDANNPWALAEPLTYTLGKNSDAKGVTGDSYRNNHPLKNVGTNPASGKTTTFAGDQVYKEDLLDMTTEFNNILVEQEAVFRRVAKYYDDYIKEYPYFTWEAKFRRLGAFRRMVTDNGRYDLKSNSRSNLQDIKSFAGVVIGEWSMYGGTLTRYDDYGNISYGYWGKVYGYSKSTLLGGSNINQFFKSFSFDEGRDATMIKVGILLYETWKK